MDDDSRDLRPFAGSKRPSPNPAPDDREVKKPRTQPRDDDVDYSIPVNELPDRPQLKLPFGNLPYRPRIESSPSPSNQLDISMRNPSIHVIPTPSRSFEGSLPSVGFNSQGGSSGDHSQESDVSSRIDVTPNEQSVFSESKVIKPRSQHPATSPLTDVMEIDSSYDTCFGVIIATPTSSFQEIGTGAHAIPVYLKLFAGTLLLFKQNPNTYAGLLSHSGLVNALYQLRQLHVRLDATLFISAASNTSEIKKPRTGEITSAKAAREYSVRIVFHGLRDDKKAIGETLSDAKCFLQHPFITEVMPGVQYDNPHYLLRPGAEMSKLIIRH